MRFADEQAMRRYGQLPGNCIAPIAAAGLAVLALVLISSAERANAGGCHHTDREAKQISTRGAKRAVICLINNKRANHGLRELEPNGDLNDAARKHSRHMQRHGCFSHECPGEPALGSRLRRSGYLGSGGSAGYGENIAWGSGRLGSSRSIVDSWMHSSGHRANILDRDFEHIGVGVAWGSPSSPRADAGLYTADFGFKR